NLHEVIRCDESHLKFLIGDFNARIGKLNDKESRIKNFGIREGNENKNRISELLFAACLFYRNSFLRKKESRRWARESTSGMIHADIDHILTNRRWYL
ncbi:hypothetical protein Angca_001524, partial [Angiostrongylus cantonensis]